MQATPHLMLYALHEPAPAYKLRRLLLTSANLSAAAWGYRAPAGPAEAEAPLQVRSFELGVSVRPLDDQQLPIDLDASTPCANPYVGRMGAAASDCAGQLFY
jgi:hypothetical protein